MLLLPLMAPDNSVSDDYVNFDANADFDNSILDAINDDMINIIEKVFINTNELDISMVSRKILEDFLAPLRQFSTNISDDIEKYLKASKKIKARQMLKEKSKQLTRPWSTLMVAILLYVMYKRYPKLTQLHDRNMELDIPWFGNDWNELISKHQKYLENFLSFFITIEQEINIKKQAKVISVNIWVEKSSKPTLAETLQIAIKLSAISISVKVNNTQDVARSTEEQVGRIQTRVTNILWQKITIDSLAELAKMQDKITTLKLEPSTPLYVTAQNIAELIWEVLTYGIQDELDNEEDQVSSLWGDISIETAPIPTQNSGK